MATHREQVLKRLGLPKDTSLSISELSKLTETRKEILDNVFRRGVAAHSSNLASVRLKDFTKNPDTKQFGIQSRLSPQQWGYGRVYAYLNKSPTYYGADSDLRR
jgi:hypothetical protein